MKFNIHHHLVGVASGVSPDVEGGILPPGPGPRIPCCSQARAPIPPGNIAGPATRGRLVPYLFSAGAQHSTGARRLRRFHVRHSNGARKVASFQMVRTQRCKRRAPLVWGRAVPTSMFLAFLLMPLLVRGADVAPNDAPPPPQQPVVL